MNESRDCGRALGTGCDQVPQKTQAVDGELRGTSKCAEQRTQVSPGPDRVIHAEVKLRAIENFSAVMYHCVQNGGKATRAGWNSRGMHVEAQFPDLKSKMSRPYMFIQDAMGIKTPWVPSQGDLFATDWALLPDNYVYNPF